MYIPKNLNLLLFNLKVIITVSGIDLITLITFKSDENEIVVLPFVSGTDHLDLLICGICDNLAVKPLVHDGGYNQTFCQRFFCGSCVPTRVNSLMYQRVNRRGNKETSCVFYPNCTIDFNHPYFRKPSGFERMEFNKVIITCLHCPRRFNIQGYLDHIIQCIRGESSVVRPRALNNNNDGVVIPEQPWVQQSLRNLKLQVSSVNQLRVPIIPVQHGDNNNDKIIIKFRSINGFHSSEFPVNISCVDAMKQLADEFNLDANQIELLFVSHMSIYQFDKLIDFVQDCPEHGDLNLLTKNNSYSNPRNDLRLTILGAHPNRGYYSNNNNNNVDSA
ncbi:uncharacterized protein LOC128393011 [Panonychus citri]|uniref:uncharacterized protein LOC128393011 n=1 Tax=Panonychus citri TaxID=50023 RepID=UPI0023079193|nr:uncharacterized protein LOC128393011 [Panonychus citri]